MHKEQAKELTSEDKAKNGNVGDSDDKTKKEEEAVEWMPCRELEDGGQEPEAEGSGPGQPTSAMS